jgi:type VI secretion system protein ImpK
MFKRKPKADGRTLQPGWTVSTTSADTRLLWKADAVLALAVQLRATRSVSDLNQLRERIAAILFDFQEKACADGIDAARVSWATEILAALIDHAVISMPWGAEAGWQSISMSTARSSARRPAQRLLEITRASSSEAGLRELISVALLLGFDKRSRGADDAPIEQTIALLALYQHRQGEQRLSPEWKSAVERRTAYANWLPFWVSSFVVAALLAVLFFTLELSLGARSDQVYARMAALNRRVAMPEQPQLASSPRLAGVLSTQMAASNLFVRDEIDRSYIIVPNTKLFEADGALLRPDSTAVLRPIAAALLGTPGRIQVIGHTDRTGERSARYPSDWDLSVDRARAVQQALRDLGVAASRIAYDGRGSIEPLRAGDRVRAVSGAGRIEIILLAGR